MIQIILADESAAAMKFGGVLLDHPDLNLQVVTDGRSLLDRLNDAPNFFHAVIMSYDLPEIGGQECLKFIKQFHERICVLVLTDSGDTDSTEAELLEELGGLGVRKKHVLGKDADAKTFGSWVRFSLDEAGLTQQS